MATNSLTFLPSISGSNSPPLESRLVLVIRLETIKCGRINTSEAWSERKPYMSALSSWKTYSSDDPSWKPVTMLWEARERPQIDVLGTVSAVLSANIWISTANTRLVPVASGPRHTSAPGWPPHTKALCPCPWTQVQGKWFVNEYAIYNKYKLWHP